MGGIASGIARRKKADLRKSMEIMAKMPLFSHREVTEILDNDSMSFSDIEHANVTVMEKIGYNLLAQAKAGAPWAVELVMKTFGVLLPEAGSQDTYNTLVLVHQSSKGKVDKVFPNVVDIATRHGELLKPKEEYYNAQMIVTANPKDSE